MCTVKTSALARAGLLGNPSDLYGGRGIGFTIQGWQVDLELAEATEVDLGSDLLLAGWKVFCAHTGRGPEAGFTATFTTTIPRQVGLAGSSAILIALLRALAIAFATPLDPLTMARLALSAEVDLLGIRWLLSTERPPRGFDLVRDGPVKVYGNPSALPRAFLVGEAVLASADDGPGGWVARIADPAFDPGETAVVERPLATPLSGGPVAGGVVFEAYDPQASSLRVEADRPALLVMTDIVYPGWTAALDGRPVEMHVVDGVFRGIEVPPGTHRVEIRYEIGTFLALLWIGCTAWFLWFAGLAAAAFRRFSDGKA